MSTSSIAYEHLLPQITFGESIPKIIHQTFKTKDLPEDLLEARLHIQKLNPEWEMKLYDDKDIEQYVRTYYGEKVWDYFLRISPEYGAARADLFRYLVMYREGGVYLDIKSSLTRPLDEVILPTDRILLAHWDNEEGEFHHRWGLYKELRSIPKGEILQWFIIATAGHPFLRQVILSVLYNIDHYNPFMTGVGLYGVLRTTGPIAYTLSISELLPQNPTLYRLSSNYKEWGLVYTIYEGKEKWDQHKKILGNNYNVKTAPVIRVSRTTALLFKPYLFIKEKIKTLYIALRR